MGNSKRPEVAASGAHYYAKTMRDMAQGAARPKLTPCGEMDVKWCAVNGRGWFVSRKNVETFNELRCNFKNRLTDYAQGGECSRIQE
jgi:hypothetical protein